MTYEELLYDEIERKERDLLMMKGRVFRTMISEDDAEVILKMIPSTGISRSDLANRCGRFNALNKHQRKIFYAVMEHRKKIETRMILGDHNGNQKALVIFKVDHDNRDDRHAKNYKPDEY